MTPPLAISLGIVCLLLGFFLRTGTSHPFGKKHSQIEKQAQPPLRPRSSDSYQRAMARNLQIPDSKQRWLNTIALLEKAELSDMLAIAQSVKYYDERLIQLIAQRWFELNPRHFFETSLAEKRRTPSGHGATFPFSPFLRFLAQEWPQHDFDAAFATFSRHDLKFYLGDVRDEFVNHLCKTDLNKALKLYFTKEWGSLSTIKKHLRKQAIDDLGPTAQLIFEHCRTFDGNRNWMTDEFITILGEAYVAINPRRGLSFAQSQQTSQGQYLQDQIIDHWLQSDRVTAYQWLQEQPFNLQEKHRYTLVKSWARDDPDGALSFSKKYLKDPKTSRAMVRLLIEGAAAKDPSKAAGLIPEIENQDLKNQAASQLAEEWFIPVSNFRIPNGAIDWLRSLGNSPTGQAAMEGVIKSSGYWIDYDADSIKDYLAEQRDFSYPMKGYEKVVEYLTKRDPIEALEWSSTLGEKSEWLLKKSAEIWVEKRPAAATNWLSEAPDSEAAKAAIQDAFTAKLSPPGKANPVIKKIGPEKKAGLQDPFKN